MNQYEVLCEKWRKEFLNLDLEKVTDKLEGFALTENDLEFQYFGQLHRIDRETGEITNTQTKEAYSDFGNLMVIYHQLYYSKEHPVAAGEWVPFREVKTAGIFDAAYQKMVLQPFARAFSGKLKLLEDTVQKLGYEKERYGDVSFRVPVFESLSVIYIFWDGDEEYPAQANMLFDKNITDFTHPETVVLIAEEVTGRILRAAGMEYHSIQEIR